MKFFETHFVSQNMVCLGECSMCVFEMNVYPDGDIMECSMAVGSN